MGSPRRRRRPAFHRAPLPSRRAPRRRTRPLRVRPCPHRHFHAPRRPHHGPVPAARAVGLYVRDSGDLPTRKIAPDKWKLGPEGKTVEMPAGFEGAKLYEFVYEGKDPVVAGTASPPSATGSRT